MTIFIAHRGNLNGSCPNDENRPLYIEHALSLGYDVEIDIWYKEGEYYLGHDAPTHLVSVKFLVYYGNNLWLHVKNEETLNHIRQSSGLNYFWHNNDEFTLTSKGFVWSFPSKKIYPNYINLMPEINNISASDFRFKNVCGICSDYIKNLKDEI